MGAHRVAGFPLLFGIAKGVVNGLGGSAACNLAFSDSSVLDTFSAFA
jgi:hypothetical protein